MREIYELSEPDRVSFGTVGEVGERVFLLQARQGQQVVTLKLEKTQVSTLCHVLGRLLRGLDGPGELPPGGTDLEPLLRAVRPGGGVGGHMRGGAFPFSFGQTWPLGSSG